MALARWLSRWIPWTQALKYRFITITLPTPAPHLLLARPLAGGRHIHAGLGSICEHGKTSQGVRKLRVQAQWLRARGAHTPTASISAAGGVMPWMPQGVLRPLLHAGLFMACTSLGY